MSATILQHADVRSVAVRHTERRIESATNSNASSKRTHAALWTVQALLALLFLFAGGMKLIMPIEAMTRQMPVPLPGAFLQFIGVAEVTGAIGLILPGLLRIRPALTPLAASGLVIIMIGATVVTLLGGVVAPAAVPAVVGLLAAFVAYGRWHVAPLHDASHRSVLLPTR
jgi:DoxX-like protein